MDFLLSFHLLLLIFSYYAYLFLSYFSFLGCSISNGISTRASKNRKDGRESSPGSHFVDVVPVYCDIFLLR